MKYTQPKANPPICWRCDKRLYAGGRVHESRSVDDPVIGWKLRVFHVACAEQFDKESK